MIIACVLLAGCTTPVDASHLEVSSPAASLEVRSTGQGDCSDVEGTCWTLKAHVINQAQAAFASGPEKWTVSSSSGAADAGVRGPASVAAGSSADFTIEIADDDGAPTELTFDAGGDILAITFRAGDFPE